MVIWLRGHSQIGDRPMEPSLAEIEQERTRLYQELADTDDFRRGSLTTNYRRCGKPNCACADPAHPGHGPRYLLTLSQGGRTVAQQVADGPELERTRREIANYQRFRSLVQEIVEVNGRICDARPVSLLAADQPSGEGKKRGSSGSSKRTSPPR